MLDDRIKYNDVWNFAYDRLEKYIDKASVDHSTSMADLLLVDYKTNGKYKKFIDYRIASEVPRSICLFI